MVHNTASNSISVKVYLLSARNLGLAWIIRQNPSGCFCIRIKSSPLGRLASQWRDVGNFGSQYASTWVVPRACFVPQMTDLEQCPTRTLSSISGVVGQSGGIVDGMYLRYVGYIKVFTQAPQGLSHGSTKGVFVHLWSLGHNLGASHSKDRGSPKTRVDTIWQVLLFALWLVQLDSIPRALLSLPKLLHVWIPVPPTQVFRQLDTSLVTLIMATSISRAQPPKPLLQTWINFNSSTDK